jgi:hypothetical protein
MTTTNETTTPAVPAELLTPKLLAACAIARGEQPRPTEQVALVIAACRRFAASGRIAENWRLWAYRDQRWLRLIREPDRPWLGTLAADAYVGDIYVETERGQSVPVYVGLCFGRRDDGLARTWPCERRTVTDARGFRRWRIDLPDGSTVTIPPLR